MHPTHLGLPVLDDARSLDFYPTYFGFDRAARRARARAAAAVT